MHFFIEKFGIFAHFTYFCTRQITKFILIKQQNLAPIDKIILN